MQCRSQRAQGSLSFEEPDTGDISCEEPVCLSNLFTVPDEMTYLIDMIKVSVFLCACLATSLVFCQNLTNTLKPQGWFGADQLNIIRGAEKFPVQTQLSIAIHQAGDTDYLGCLRGDSSLTSISNEQSIFEIGSISKVFTSMLMAVAIQEGRIRLNQPIQETLPFKLHTETPVTFKQLSNHSAGLPRLPENFFPVMAKSPDNPYQSYDNSHLEEYLKSEMKTLFPPGEKSQYSNLGAGLLGYLMERIYDQSYESLLQEKICQPLNLMMTSTKSPLAGYQEVEGQNRHGKKTSHWDFLALAGAGAVRSSVTDLMKFAEYNFQENEINDLMQGKTMDVDGDIGVALGWHTFKLGEVVWIWHNGGTGGFRSCLAICPSQKRAVAILSNVSAFHKESDVIDQICRQLAKSISEHKN